MNVNNSSEKEVYHENSILVFFGYLVSHFREPSHGRRPEPDHVLDNADPV